MLPPGFEPRTTASKAGMISISLRELIVIVHQKMKTVRLPGIEPESHPWQGRVLPLNHSRKWYDNTVFGLKNRVCAG